MPTLFKPKKTISLSPDESIELEILIEQIKEGKQGFVSRRLLTKYSPADMFRFSESSLLVKKFCEQDEYVAHLPVWAAALAEASHLSKKIIAANGLEVTVCDHYLGSYIIEQYDLARAQYEKKSAEADPQTYLYWLEEGCKRKLLPSLVASCEEERSNIQNAKSVPAEADFTHKFDANLEIMSQLYMTMGYMNAARLCFDLAGHYETVKATDLALEYYQKAAYYFFCGKDLYERKLPEDVELIQVISKGNGLEAFRFSSLEDAEEIIFSKYFLLAARNMEGYDEEIEVFRVEDRETAAYSSAAMNAMRAELKQDLESSAKAIIDMDLLARDHHRGVAVTEVNQSAPLNFSP
jgi:hypothetical protein